MPVAIKTTKSVSKSPMSTSSITSCEQLAEDEQRLQRDSIRDEIKIMTAVGGHPNVLQLLGACTVLEVNFCLITEYCENGSLDSFLRSKFDNEKFIDEIVVLEEEKIVYKVRSFIIR